MERMKELVALLNEAAEAYYQKDTEIMSNQQYDALYDELVDVYKRQYQDNVILWRSRFFGAFPYLQGLLIQVI